MSKEEWFKDIKTRFIFAGLILVLLFAFFVWPTLYEYREMRLKDNVLPVRINRFTGSTYLLYPSGWTIIGDEGKTSNTNMELSASDIEKLKQDVALFHEKGFIVKIYNGTKFTLKDINVLLIIKNEDGSEQSRREYRIPCYASNGNPFADDIFFAEDIKYPASTPFEWRIISVRGY